MVSCFSFPVLIFVSVFFTSLLSFALSLTFLMVYCLLQSQQSGTVYIRSNVSAAIQWQGPTCLLLYSDQIQHVYCCYTVTRSKVFTVTRSNMSTAIQWPDTRWCLRYTVIRSDMSSAIQWPDTRWCLVLYSDQIRHVYCYTVIRSDMSTALHWPDPRCLLLFFVYH